MKSRVRGAMDLVLLRFVEMGVLKQSQVNGTLLTYAVQALGEGFDNQKLQVHDFQYAGGEHDYIISKL